MMIGQDEKHFTKLDLTSKNLKKIEKFSAQIQFDVALFDSNEITKIEHLDVFQHLIELSISHNRLIDIRLLSRLKTLQKLNLSHNSIDSVDPLKTLTNLTTLNLSTNNIGSLAPLNSCVALQWLDASDNSLRQIDDLSHLKSLKLLNLRRNLIDRLSFGAKFWPKSLRTLIISDNEFKDLTEISFLSSFNQLKNFALENNPCLYTPNERYDYRPYVLNWCLSIENLDDLPVTRRESLKAEWLLSQGRGRAFRPGEHHELVEYLIKVCGTDADERNDLHLSHERKPKKEKLLVSESAFFQITPSSSISAAEPLSPVSHTKRDESNSHNRYSDYDNRPIKPLDKTLLQTKLNEYPIGSNPTRTASASRFSPKNAAHGPMMPLKLKAKTNLDKNKRHTIAGAHPKETKPASNLQAYLDLHQRFTRTIELQTSALAALWKKLEEQNAVHQKETKMVLEENRALKKRLEELESRLSSPTLHPPLHAHISKRDQKSFLLHWSSNPLNDQQAILGYRIYIDDVFKGSTDRDHFEAIIDCIRDEGEYRLKLRTFNNQRESADSNVVIARFRRQSAQEPLIGKASPDSLSFSPPAFTTRLLSGTKASFDSATIPPLTVTSCDRKSC